MSTFYIFIIHQIIQIVIVKIKLHKTIKITTITILEH